MTIDVKLSRQWVSAMGLHDEAVVGELLHQRGWSTAFAVADMVNQWAWLVREVERGSTDVVEEYSNDLYGSFPREMWWWRRHPRIFAGTWAMHSNPQAPSVPSWTPHDANAGFIHQ
ncbi:hypothetical protein ACFCYH_24005 [Streptomyces sp. NPDC056400]|uniref:hypothetical protein n=1 Tax=Streptomyces sp. NPDC056400 TaxID=3345808 RepID=UPI0035DF4CA7